MLRTYGIIVKFSLFLADTLYRFPPRGNFGVVRKVTQRSSEKVYAAKYITPSSRSSGSSREDILHEISIMNQLHHKRLVGLIDAFEAPGKIIMIMEL